MNAIDGIMGYFVRAIPVDVKEFGEKGIGLTTIAIANHLSMMKFLITPLADTVIE
jgi:hypothetical protein